MVFSAFREVNPKDHPSIYPLNSPRIRSMLTPELSISAPGLFDLPPHPLSFFGVFGILAVGCSIVKGGITALTPDGIHHYTAIPARYFFSDDQNNFFGNGCNTASGCRSNYNAPIYQPFLYVRKWRITQDSWQPVARKVFRLQVPIPIDTIEIPENARDRRMLLTWRDQGLLSLERLFTGKNLANYTHIGDVTFTSLTFFYPTQVLRTLPPVPQNAIHEAVAIALGHSSSGVKAGRRTSVCKEISAQGSVLNWWYSLIWRNSRWSCLASEPIPEGTFKQRHVATDPVFRGDLLIYHDQGRGVDMDTGARLIVDSDPNNDILIPIKKTQDGQLRFELPGGKLLHTPDPQGVLAQPPVSGDA